MYFVYKIYSKGLKKSYVGATNDVQRRMGWHRWAHPDWFVDGHRLTVLSKHRLLPRALLAEANAMLAHKTLTPYGLNRHTGGAIGQMIAKIPASERLKMRGKFTQYACDIISANRIRRQPIAPSHDADRARHRKAWKRFHQGLAAIPGTEHYLQREEVYKRPKQNPEVIARRTKAVKRHYKAMKDKGIDIGKFYKMGRPHTQEAREKMSDGRVRLRLTQGHPNTWRNLKARVATAKKRQKKGLPPIPGTEILLMVDTNPMGTASNVIEQRRAAQRQTVDRVNAWERAYAIKQGWRDS